MSHDPLSDVLCSVRLRGAAFWYVSCRDDWAAASPEARALGDVVMPGAEHVLAYHLIAKGSSWATMDGAPPVRLDRGDIVMFPRGDAHLLSSAPGMRVAHDDGDELMNALRNEPRPIPINFRGGVLEVGAGLPAEEASTIAVCGFIGCDLRPFNPLIEALPRLLHLPAGGVGEWVPSVLHQAASESRLRDPGSAAVLERVSEMLFVDAARRYLQSLPEGASGWLAALRDRHVGKAIGLMHERLADPWTIEDLGRQVGLSRSALHERFMQMVGQAPMQYLTNWRMQAGARLLREGRATVATIAQEVGYESEAAFARAFKRLVGLPPAAWRRSQRLSG
jgi:AraC-like DNA-binding protein